MRGSANAEALLDNGAIIGTPRYASYEPHHVRIGDGWYYVNMFYPEEEVALTWIAEGRDIIVDNLWVATESDGMGDEDAWIRNGYTDVICISCRQVVEAIGFDIEKEDEDGENEWLSASVAGNIECINKKVVTTIGSYHFFSKDDAREFISDVSALREEEMEQYADYEEDEGW